METARTVTAPVSNRWGNQKIYLYATVTEGVCNTTNSLDTPQGVICDGTAVNTERVSGVVKRGELFLERPLQWIVCLLHLNEFPFHHLFDAIDEKTTGPATFAGEIRKQIKHKVHQLQLVTFQAVPSDIPQISSQVVNDLSTDQRCLCKICQAVSMGKVSEELKRRSPGALHYVRWLTLANLIMHFYFSSSNPSNKLKDLVKILMQLYAPGWFQIKSHPSVSNGARNFWYILSCSKKLKVVH